SREGPAAHELRLRPVELRGRQGERRGHPGAPGGGRHALRRRVARRAGRDVPDLDAVGDGALGTPFHRNEGGNRMFRSVAGRCSALGAVVLVIATLAPAAPVAGRVVVPPAPGARDKGSLAYDGMRGQVVLFGGCCDENTGASFGDTWTWDGTGWT